jgi:hypothetical protein
MTNRREFIQHGVALSAAPLVLGPRLGLAADAHVRMRPVLAVFDRNYAEGRLFARAAESRGIATHAIDGDVTALWYDDLYHRWKGGPAPIVGLTGASSLFCLEQLAWKVERRVVFRADHHQRADGRIDHALAGPSPLQPLLAALEDDAAWPLASASAVQGLPAALRRGVRFQGRAVGASLPGPQDWKEPLATWAIALKPSA